MRSRFLLVDRHQLRYLVSAPSYRLMYPRELQQLTSVFLENIKSECKNILKHKERITNGFILVSIKWGFEYCKYT